MRTKPVCAIKEEARRKWEVALQKMMAPLNHVISKFAWPAAIVKSKSLQFWTLWNQRNQQPFYLCTTDRSLAMSTKEPATISRMYNLQKYQNFHKGATTLSPMYNGQKYHNFHKGTSNRRRNLCYYIHPSHGDAVKVRWVYLRGERIQHRIGRNHAEINFHPCTTDRSNTALSFQRVVDLIIHISSTTVFLPRLTRPHIQHPLDHVQRSLCPCLLIHTSSTTRSCPTVFLPRLTHPHIQHPLDHVQRSFCPGLLIHTSSTHHADPVQRSLCLGLLIHISSTH